MREGGAPSRRAELGAFRQPAAFARPTKEEIMLTIRTALLAPVLAAVLRGGDDPLADKPKATVSSASPTPATSAAQAPAASASAPAAAAASGSAGAVPAALVTLTPPTAPAGALTIDAAG